jgi:hypothetical protein
VALGGAGVGPEVLSKNIVISLLDIRPSGCTVPR